MLFEHTESSPQNAEKEEVYHNFDQITIDEKM